MDKKYWKNYYSQNLAPREPSPFAQSIELVGDTYLELGCGNGRDVLYFYKKYPQMNFTVIDQCKAEVFNRNIRRLNFIEGDFTRPNINSLFDSIYSRFTLHSITEEEEVRVLKWVYNNLSYGGNFFIEVRSKKDEFESDHYRRFIDFESFKKRLIDVGFKIEYAEEKNGFAKYKNENPTCIRVITKV